MTTHCPACGAPLQRHDDSRTWQCTTCRITYHDHDYVIQPQTLTIRTHTITSRPTKKRKAQVKARDGHACVYCGSTQDLTVDHVIPRFLGGKNTMSNLVTACFPCNRAKGSRLYHPSNYVKPMRYEKHTLMIPTKPEDITNLFVCLLEIEHNLKKVPEAGPDLIAAIQSYSGTIESYLDPRFVGSIRRQVQSLMDQNAPLILETRQKIRDSYFSGQSETGRSGSDDYNPIQP